MSNETNKEAARIKELEAALAKETARADKAEKNAGSTSTLRNQLKEVTNKLKVLEKTAPKNTKPTVEVDGVHYQLRGVPRGMKSFQDLANNEKALRKLIEMGSGLLKKVNIN